MKKIRVAYITDATNSVEIEVPDDFDPTDNDQRDAAFDGGWEDLRTTLCHQCADIDLGDWVPYLISDAATGDETWRDESV